MWCAKALPFLRDFVLWYIIGANVLTFGVVIGYEAYARNCDWWFWVWAVIPTELLFIGVGVFAFVKHVAALKAIKTVAARGLDV